MSDWNLDTRPPGKATVVSALPSTPPAGRGRRPARLRLYWIAGGIVLLVAGALIGFYLARSQSGQEADELVTVREELGRMEAALAQSEQRLWDYYRRVQDLTADVEELKAGLSELPPADGGPAPTTSQPLVLGGTYGDGVYLVGEDIAPGTYDGVVTGDVGYWARLKGTDGTVASIIANGIPRGPFILTVIESDAAVELRGVEITAR